MNEELTAVFTNYFSMDPSVSGEAANEINQIPANDEIAVEICQILLTYGSDTPIHKIALQKFYNICNICIKDASEEAEQIIKKTVLQIYPTEKDFTSIFYCKTIIEYFLVKYHASWPELDEFMTAPTTNDLLILYVLKEYIENITTPDTSMQFFEEHFSELVNRCLSGENRVLFYQSLNFLFNFGVQALKNWDAFNGYKELIMERYIAFAPTLKTRNESNSFFKFILFPKFCHYFPSFEDFFAVEYYDQLTTLESKEEFMLMMINIITNNGDEVSRELVIQLIEPILILRKEMIENEIDPTITAENFSHVLSVIDESGACELFETISADDSFSGKKINLFFIESFAINNNQCVAFDEYLTALIGSDPDMFAEAVSVYTEFIGFKNLSNEKLCEIFFAILSVHESLAEDEEGDNTNDNLLSGIIIDLQRIDLKLNAEEIFQVISTIAAILQKSFFTAAHYSLLMLKNYLSCVKRTKEEVEPLIQPLIELTTTIFGIDDIYLHSIASIIMSNIILIIPEAYESIIPQIVTVLMQDIAAESTDIFGVLLKALTNIIKGSFKLKEISQRFGQPFEVYDAVLNSVFEQIPFLMEKSVLDKNMTYYVAKDGLRRLQFFLSVSINLPDNQELFSYILTMLVTLLGVDVIYIDPKIIYITEKIFSYADYLEYNVDEVIKVIINNLSYRAQSKSPDVWFVFEIFSILENNCGEPIAFCEETQVNFIDSSLNVFDTILRQGVYQNRDHASSIIKYIVNTVSYESLPVEFLQRVIEWIESSIVLPDAFVINSALTLLGAVISRGQGFHLIEGSIPIAMQQFQTATFDGATFFFISLLKCIEELDPSLLEEIKNIVIGKLSEIADDDMASVEIREDLYAILIKLSARGLFDPEEILEIVLKSPYVKFSDNSRDIILCFLLENFQTPKDDEIKSMILRYFSFYAILENDVIIEIDEDIYQMIFTILANEYTTTGSLEFSHLNNQLDLEKLKESIEDFIEDERKKAEEAQEKE